jgi:hypothetical protein
MVSPAEPPLPATDGVVSEVRSSVDDDPRSDAASRSGAAGAEGAEVSTAIDMDEPADETFPAGSVSVPDTDHDPSVRPESSQDVAEPTVYEHVFVVEPFVAVTVAVSPVDPPGTENVGVVSEVTLSLFEVPVSEPDARSGAPGAEVAVESTVNGRPELAADWLPAGSVRRDVNVHEPSVRTGRSHDVAEPTTYEQDSVEAPFVAVIVIVSPADPPDPDTLGVVSAVRSSVPELPVSDTGDRSGVPGADGAVVSTDTGSAGPAVDVLPAGSVTFAVIDQLPAVSVGRSHEDAEPAT